MMPAMIAAIAARSLSSLNDLGNSPPSDPPLQLQNEEPLVLYIARVPGSRADDQDDVLLQDEIRSHQDPKDDFYGDGSKESKQTQNVMQMKQNEPSQPVIQAQASTSSNTKLNLPTGQTIARKPVSHKDSQAQPKPSQGPVRKILGPRPITNRSSPLISGDSQDLNETSLFHTPESMLQTSQTSLKTEKDTALNEAFKSFSPYTNVASGNRYITLIRRDPATGNQWNIGRLSLLEPRSSSSPNRSPKRRNRDVLIELSVPGYVRFSDKASDSQTAVFTRHLDFSHATNIGNSFQASSPTSSTVQPPQPTFLTPWQTPCAFQTAVTGRVLKCYHSLPDSLLRPSPRIMSGKRPQAALVSELRFNLPNIIEKSTMKKKENRRPVSFQARSHDGHNYLNGLPILSDNLTNTSMSNDREQGEIPNTLSEPSSSQGMLKTPPMLPPRSREFPPSASHYRAHSDNSVLTYQHNTDGTKIHAIDTPLDLSLGQERAGGGFNGNKAKLGKLIIYGGQGFAMLDLLVAANMGVWFNDLL